MLRKRIKQLFPFFIVLIVPFFSAAKDTLTLVERQNQYYFSSLPIKNDASFSRPKIGLVLSGGGARAVAQIGVLRSLEKHQIPIDLIVGNSLGSIVGGLYASGYTSVELESIFLNTNWIEVLSFSESTERTELFVSQKPPEHIGYLLIRFDGLQPLIPSSISGGQRISNYLMKYTLQAPYHPITSFDDLMIPFRAVATDLLTGKRIILDRGSLAEAMRASATVPLLYTPLDKDSMILVDGGLNSNIPVDVAKSLGCDVIIAVNSTSEMRREGELNMPWEVADQIMTIMMQNSNQQQLELADIVITPDVGDRLVSDFSQLDELIVIGEQETDKVIEEINRIIEKESIKFKIMEDKPLSEVQLKFQGNSIPSIIKEKIFRDFSGDSINISAVQSHIQLIWSTQQYQEVTAQFVPHSSFSKVIFRSRLNPEIQEIKFRGNYLISDKEIYQIVNDLKDRVLNFKELQLYLEKVIRFYRSRGYSLARINNVFFDTTTNILEFSINEGKIQSIAYEGNQHTKDYVIRRELTFKQGDVFNLDAISRSLQNVVSTGLFEYVLLDIRYQQHQPQLVIKVKERSSDLLLLGVGIDNERGLVGTVNIRDANFRGAGEDLGLFLRYGNRGYNVCGEYKANRIFRTYLTFHLKGYFMSYDILTYRFEPPIFRKRWDRIEDGKYSEIKNGWSFTFGTHLERLGNVTADLRVERHRIKPITGRTPPQDRYRLVGLKLQSTIDTENKFFFPTEGMLLSMSLESASKNFGSQVTFSKVDFNYEIYLTPFKRHTIRPKITLGYADRVLPVAEQYRWGGFTSFFGLREDDKRGRQLFLVNMEYRYWLPFTILFDTYFKARYDFGMISEIPEEIKFSKFRHGIGLEIALETTLGVASFGLGKSFYFRQLPADAPITIGPLLIYFSIGVVK